MPAAHPCLGSCIQSQTGSRLVQDPRRCGPCWRESTRHQLQPAQVATCVRVSTYVCCLGLQRRRQNWQARSSCKSAVQSRQAWAPADFLAAASNTMHCLRMVCDASYQWCSSMCLCCPQQAQYPCVQCEAEDRAFGAELHRLTNPEGASSRDDSTTGPWKMKIVQLCWVC